MKNIAVFFVIALAFAISALSLAALWLKTPALWVINLPESAWLFLVNKLGATCCESSADIELAVAVAFGAIATSLLSLLLYGAYRFVRAR